jgi:hypothetical protein
LYFRSTLFLLHWTHWSLHAGMVAWLCHAKFSPRH